MRKFIIRNFLSEDAGIRCYLFYAGAFFVFGIVALLFGASDVIGSIGRICIFASVLCFGLYLLVRNFKII